MSDLITPVENPSNLSSLPELGSYNENSFQYSSHPVSNISSSAFAARAAEEQALFDSIPLLELNPSRVTAIPRRVIARGVQSTPEQVTKPTDPFLIRR